jgi:hypothetical protein
LSLVFLRASAVSFFFTCFSSQSRAFSSRIEPLSL